MSIFATNEQVQELKERALQWQAAGYPGADPLMPAILDLLLQFPDIAPVWSCEGHDMNPKEGRKRASDFYIMFAVTMSGYYTLQELYKDMRDILMPLHDAQLERSAKLRVEQQTKLVIDDNPLPYSPVQSLALVTTTRSWPGDDGKDGKVRWYNVVNFNGFTRTESSKKVFFDALTTTLVSMLNLRTSTIYKNVRIRNLNLSPEQHGILPWPEGLVNNAIESFNARRISFGEFGYQFRPGRNGGERRHIQVEQDKVSHMPRNLRVVDGWLVADIEVNKRLPYGATLYKLLGDTYPEFTDPADVPAPVRFKLRFIAHSELGNFTKSLMFITIDAVNNDKTVEEVQAWADKLLKETGHAPT